MTEQSSSRNEREVIEEMKRILWHLCAINPNLGDALDAFKARQEDARKLIHDEPIAPRSERGTLRDIEGALRVMGAYREALDATGQWTASIAVGEAMHRIQKWALEPQPGERLDSQGEKNGV